MWGSRCGQRLGAQVAVRLGRSFLLLLLYPQPWAGHTEAAGRVRKDAPDSTKKGRTREEGKTGRLLVAMKHTNTLQPHVISLDSE